MGGGKLMMMMMIHMVEVSCSPTRFLVINEIRWSPFLALLEVKFPE